MKTFIRRAAMAAIISAATVTTVTARVPAYAAPARNNARDAKAPAGPQVRREVGIPLQDALKLINANDLDGAMAKLAIADMVPMKTPFEEYTISEYMFTVYFKKMDFLNALIRTKDEAGARQTLDMMATVSKKPEVWDQVMDFALGQPGISDHQLLN